MGPLPPAVIQETRLSFNIWRKVKQKRPQYPPKRNIRPVDGWLNEPMLSIIGSVGC